MGLKRLVPLATRDRLRPAFHRLQKWTMRTRQTLRSGPFWPKPSSWQALAREANASRDTAALYRLAMEHFGIQQIEAEIVPFLESVAEQRPRVVGEIGLKHGGNTFLFTQALREMALFIGVDLHVQNVEKLRFLAQHGCTMRFIEGSSYAPTTVDRVRRLLAGRQFDFLFIDGDHEYEGVVQDFVSYYPLVRPGGLIALHDIVPDNFARTGCRIPGSKCHGGGVHRLWRALRDQFPHREFVDSWEQNAFGIGVATKSGDEPLEGTWVSTLMMTA